MYLGIDLNDLMKLGSVVNDDELDPARKSVMMFKTIKQFQNSFMEIEKVCNVQNFLLIYFDDYPNLS